MPLTISVLYSSSCEAAFGFENLAILGFAVNGVTYFNGIMHYDLAGAANVLTNFMGTSYLVTIVIALLADTKLGRYRAVVISGCIEFLVNKDSKYMIYLIHSQHEINCCTYSSYLWLINIYVQGLALLTIQAHYPHLKPPLCNMFLTKCDTVSGGKAAILFVGLYLIAVGTGGIKAGLPSHGADQFNEKDPLEKKQMSSFFNWLLLSLCIGGAISLVFIVRIQTDKGWDWGFGISSIAMFLAIIIFVSGFNKYRMHVIHGSSALIEIVQVRTLLLCFASQSTANQIVANITDLIK